MRANATIGDALFRRTQEDRAEREAELVVGRVCKRFHVSVDALKHGDGGQVYAARRAAYYLLHQLGLSYPRIACLMGGKHHTSVMSGVKKARIEARRSPRVARELRALMGGKAA